jgi:hypothetical protein
VRGAEKRLLERLVGVMVIGVGSFLLGIPLFAGSSQGIIGMSEVPRGGD